MNRALIALTFSLPLLAGDADFIRVKLSVAAPTNWVNSIKDELTTRLNAVPDVQVVDEKAADSAFTVIVDVNNVTNKENETLGYSMMALLMGTYDQRFLDASFIEAKKTVPKENQELWDLLRFSASGNVFLAGWVHTHGGVSSISDAYDQIVGKLKTKGLPEYRQFLTMAMKVVKDLETPKPLSLKVN